VFDCLVQVLVCMPPDFAFAVVESALRNRLLSPPELARLRSTTTRAGARLLTHVDSLADSGTESLFRYRLLCLGILTRSQVRVPGVGRVDFLIGDRLLVEIDSETFHGSPAQRQRDLDRDAIAFGLGFLVLHFDYRQVLYDWDTVQATVLAVIGRGDHARRA
jgi:very-short-patch-repair endonuclease